MIDFSIQLPKKQAKRRVELAEWIPKFTDKKVSGKKLILRQEKRTMIS